MADALLKGTEPEINDTTTYDNGIKIIPSYLLEPVSVDVSNYEEVVIDSGYHSKDELWSAVVRQGEIDAPLPVNAPGHVAEARSSQTILEMRGISKTFPGVKALDNANFVVTADEIHALVGENGAGKSTLMKVLSA